MIDLSRVKFLLEYLGLECDRVDYVYELKTAVVKLCCGNCRANECDKCELNPIKFLK